jgi:anaerobic magnesium-protoporphyrin IX monomethyl ester cyclase
LEGFKNKPRGIWWERSLDKQESARIIKLLAANPELLGPKFAKLGLSEQEIHKHCLLEVLPHHLESGCFTAEEDPHLLVAYYGKGQSGETEYFYVPLDRLHAVRV